MLKGGEMSGQTVRRRRLLQVLTCSIADTRMAWEEAKATAASAVEHWLEQIGLSRYAGIFLQSRIDLDVVTDLTDADLAELGLPLGDRKRLLRAIDSLLDTSAARPPAVRATSVGLPTAAERRHLTVMFCDMEGSTALSEQFDPEDLRDRITAYRETCARVIERYDGFVAKYVGDGILVYFGYPNAHEDEAERAVRTGLEIVQAVSKQSEDSLDPREDASGVRIGIATGVVVVGDVIGESTQERDSVMGETPNLAARLQALAPRNGVVIASSTKSLLRAKFDYEDLGSHTLKGISKPVQAWRVVRPGRIESRFAATADTKITPLVDRQEEIALLLMRWQQAKECDGQVVLLSGEAGIGKSRIIEEFRARIASEAHRHISFQCSPYYTSTAFYPFIEQLKSMADFDREGSPELSLQRLEAIVAESTDSVEPITPLFAALLSIPTGDRYEPLDLSPQRQKDETVAALVNHFIGLALKQPLIVILEDVHWIDPSSGEVLDVLVDRIHNAPVLILITCRSEFQPGWSRRSHITTLMLNRLSRRLRAAMVEGLAGANVLPQEVIEEIIVKTDGIPLFVEELTKTVLESNILCDRDLFSAPLRHLAIPATLADSLMARLDRMGRFKSIAQIGSSIGREFSYELLRVIAEIPADELDAALRRLEDAGLIMRQGHPPEAVYVFRHALVQDAAHSSLLHSERKRLHARIAAVLAEKYPERAEREPELFAYHLTEACQSKPAVDFWLKAGKRATQTQANLEAIGHLRRGLEVLNGDRRIPSTDATELELRMALGISLIAGRGYAVPEVEENYLRALELGQRLNDRQRIFSATRGLWVCYFIRADLAKAHHLSVELLKLAESTDANEDGDQARQRTGQLIEAHRALGMTKVYSGSFAASRDHLQRGLSLYDPDLHSSLMEAHGTEPGIVCLAYLGFVMWFLGFPDRARECSDHALRNAERTRHPFTLAFALAFRAYLCQHLRDVEGTRMYADRTMAISSEHGFLHWTHQARMLEGWALAELGQIDAGLNQIRAGLDAYEAMESQLASPWFRSLLANAYVKAGRPDAALRALDDALAMTERTGERFFLAEIYRLLGEIMLAQRGPEAAGETETCYQRSLEVCREQQALSWELRTTVSLARLWRQLGKNQHAMDLLVPVCSRFNGGFDTPDVQEAVQLLSELEAV
jgi:class 3 adenylate cyclase/predicted ATPase